MVEALGPMRSRHAFNIECVTATRVIFIRRKHRKPRRLTPEYFVQCLGDEWFGQFLPEAVGNISTAAQESQRRCFLHPTCHAHTVAEAITPQAAGGRDDNFILISLAQRFNWKHVSRIVNELEEM